MKIISRLILPVAVLGVVACSEKDQKANNTPTATTAAPLNTTATPVTGTAAQGATAALNPAHGQPNHRCDIPVGAPLNTPAQPKLNVPTTTITPPLQPTQTQQQGSVAAGTNPPHGQPGHDCSKPVGAPL
ncbi:hypothetical protein [Pontibacter cellulosilyticus]|uniref:Uncharacterized protein n=1 Tax=Pontibacter cellulosilyticus TaxID=1720253 RepID=A0A923SIF3_9BACT|nr:hypothetical protein [Pontibacter cellulosilyticus]MBC5992754.1 hypothetical protein [Pontibacter cellulosilyticus]